MERVKLNRNQWSYNPDVRLGEEGGFGEVFQGFDEEDNVVAVKRLKLRAQDAAHRELDMAEFLGEYQFGHIMPILDYGQDADSDFYFIVMPEAGWNLQQTIDDDKEITEDEAVEILLQIATGLSEVPEIVHRDLKPSNILYHEDKWKIADFGIARFVEASTSRQTLRENLTEEYAAPEQWNIERTTSATDIYALGCIGYELLTGQPPFSADSREEMKEQHLHKPPPTIEGYHPKLRSLLSRMLNKTPGSRPNLQSVQQVLAEILSPESDKSTGSGFDELAKVGAMAAQRAAEEEAKQRSDTLRREKRMKLAQEATDIMDEVKDILVNKILDQVPTARLTSSFKSAEIHIADKAMLRIEHFTWGQLLPADAFPQSKWDVITRAIILVKQRQPEYQLSASLLYTNRGLNEGYRWWEISFFTRLDHTAHEPFDLYNLAEADQAIAQKMYLYGVASGPTAIDDENVDNFCNRWAGILAKAYQGKLQHPRGLPLPGPLE